MTEFLNRLALAGLALLANAAPLLALLVVAGAALAAVSALAGATVRNMQARGFYADAKEYLAAAQLYGWAATLRAIALGMILPAIAFNMLPPLTALAYFVLAGLSIAARVVQLGPLRRGEASAQEAPVEPAEVAA
ncbi:hypothetical protein GCM10025867_47540 (plasmid) [Frondihabitans sucicola]|uniref:Uncharacterized protein n=1 Tax=Frondihabitans sucicola TaxID=1268041 RepID=A0ABM8GVL3_9MICO|nr:hypothetical protein [Frondihabitans sucicola]BDZ52513.1 hypothetical protein GCM10025867_47540 [Frondihabitans sucicola]